VPLQKKKMNNSNRHLQIYSQRLQVGNIIHDIQAPHRKKYPAPALASAGYSPTLLSSIGFG
jgi:hypothetical protein